MTVAFGIFFSPRVVQMFGFLLYVSEFGGKDYGSSLLISKVQIPFLYFSWLSHFLALLSCAAIPHYWFQYLLVFTLQVHDRAQVFISCPTEDNSGRPTYVGTIERWSNRALSLPNFRCGSNISLFVLVTGCRCLSLNRLPFFFLSTLFLYFPVNIFPLTGWKHGPCKLWAIYVWWEGMLTREVGSLTFLLNISS